MTAADLKHRLLRLLGVESPGTAPTYVQDDVTQAVNAAYQVLWADVPPDRRSHYTRRIDTLALVAGTREYELADDVQDVIGPIYRSNDELPLTPIRHKGDILRYGLLVKGTESLANGPVEAFYLERLFQNAADATRLRLWVAPTPARDATLNLEVETQAPRFERAEFCEDPAPALRVPHDYAESILLPIAAHFAARSHWFTKKELLPILEGDYKMALGRAGVTDPQVSSAEPSK